MTDYRKIVEGLGLLPHPEGGFYRETYRSTHHVKFGSETRAASTAIYYLLHDKMVSRLHRIDADEGWYWHSGSGLRIHVFEGSDYRSIDIGIDFAAGQKPHCVIPAGAWFGAEVIGGQGFTLTSCTVAPGFEFAHFELAESTQALARWPGHQALIEKLTHPQS